MELIKFHSVIIAAVIFIFCCDIICQCQRSDKVKMQNHFMFIKLISFIKYSSVNMIQIQCTVKYIKMAYSLWTERQFRRKIVKWTQLIVSLYLNNNNRLKGLKRVFIRTGVKVIYMYSARSEFWGRGCLKWRACKQKKI